MHSLVKPAAFAGLALLSLAPNADARPEYARREKKACAFCHVNPNGGGSRNPRGVFYAMHNKTFEGYDEVKVMGTSAAAAKKAGAVSYKLSWKADLPAGATRIAVADVMGDGKPRILVLGEGHTVTVFDASTATLKQEDALDMGEKAGQFVAGQFAKGKPAVIVAPGVLYYRNGDKYAKKALTDLKDITGTVRFADGAECFFYFAGEGDPEVHAIELGAEKLLIPGRELSDPGKGAGVYNELFARLPHEFMGHLGVPEDGQKVGAIGFLDPKSEGKWFAWIPMQGKDGSFFVVANSDSLSPDGQGAELKPEWKSPKLTGKLIDVALGKDPRNPKKNGFYTLQATGDDGKGRILEFWEVE